MGKAHISVLGINKVDTSICISKEKGFDYLIRTLPLKPKIKMEMWTFLKLFHSFPFVSILFHSFPFFSILTPLLASCSCLPTTCYCCDHWSDVADHKYIMIIIIIIIVLLTAISCSLAARGLDQCPSLVSEQKASSTTFEASDYQINCPNLHTQFVTSQTERPQIFEMPALAFW